MLVWVRLKQVAHGDLGVTLFSQQQVTDVLFQRAAATTRKSKVVIAIVPVTAIPYAAPSALDVLKPSTTATQLTISA